MDELTAMLLSVVPEWHAFIVGGRPVGGEMVVAAVEESDNDIHRRRGIRALAGTLRCVLCPYAGPSDVQGPAHEGKTEGWLWCSRCRQSVAHSACASAVRWGTWCACCASASTTAVGGYAPFGVASSPTGDSLVLHLQSTRGLWPQAGSEAQWLRVVTAAKYWCAVLTEGTSEAKRAALHSPVVAPGALLLVRNPEANNYLWPLALPTVVTEAPRFVRSSCSLTMAEVTGDPLLLCLNAHALRPPPPHWSPSLARHYLVALRTALAQCRLNFIAEEGDAAGSPLQLTVGELASFESRRSHGLHAEYLRCAATVLRYGDVVAEPTGAPDAADEDVASTSELAVTLSLLVVLDAQTTSVVGREWTVHSSIPWLLVTSWLRGRIPCDTAADGWLLTFLAILLAGARQTSTSLPAWVHTQFLTATGVHRQLAAIVSRVPDGAATRAAVRVLLSAFTQVADDREGPEDAGLRRALQGLLQTRLDSHVGGVGGADDEFGWEEEVLVAFLGA